MSNQNNAPLSTPLSTPLSEQETFFLKHCLQLAENGLYTTTPNPRVGCVIVCDNTIIAQGWHHYAGAAHAEINALNDLANNSIERSNKSLDIYISLEPCVSHGKTPPCINAIIAAKPNKVVIAMLDPNPDTFGKGVAQLQAAAITTKVADTDSDIGKRAMALNIGFASRLRRGRPWVRCKIAMSLDGKTALKNGLSEWISNDDSRKDAHHWRALSCAIMTGIGTAIYDNPKLTVRHHTTSRQPLRVLVDSQARATSDMALFGDDNILWITATALSTTQAAHFKGEHIALPTTNNTDNTKQLIDLKQVMETLAKKQINEILLESGRKLNGAMLQADLIDELIVYCAPCLFGETARDMFLFPSPTHPSHAPRFKLKSATPIGDDCRLVYQCNDTPFN